ncbi:unnamed protein product [Taenia asiatica]|uniref:Secreted protein n=1 Tax=Taenia asiatica TaxID=60517 RepID=A0A0R3VYT2_TAEAS|nr:unnamed protein product [Taenia asiatica]
MLKSSLAFVCFELSLIVSGVSRRRLEAGITPIVTVFAAVLTSCRLRRRVDAATEVDALDVGRVEAHTKSRDEGDVGTISQWPHESA